MIPAVGHFIWLGKRFPWVNVLALRSAAARAGLERIVLHHDNDLSETAVWPEVESVPGIELRRCEPAQVFEGCLETGAGPLLALYERLEQPAARANMLRAAILNREGGVYLDFDTLTLASLDSLRSTAGVFCGAERLVFPADVKRSHDPRVWGRALARTATRDLLRRLPGGWRTFRAVEGFYPSAVNNAVIGASPGHPLIAELIESMVAMPRERQLKRFALGTHLLQEVVGGYSGPDLHVCAPEVFFPLGPEISEHWFRTARRLRLEEMVFPETRVVHWYASVRSKPYVAQLNPEWIRDHATTQPFSALALPFL